MTEDEFAALPRENRLPSITPWYPGTEEAVERYNEAYEAYTELTRYDVVATISQVAGILAFLLALTALIVVLGG